MRKSIFFYTLIASHLVASYLGINFVNCMEKAPQKKTIELAFSPDPQIKDISEMKASGLIEFALEKKGLITVSSPSMGSMVLETFLANERIGAQSRISDIVKKYEQIDFTFIKESPTRINSVNKGLVVGNLKMPEKGDCTGLYQTTEDSACEFYSILGPALQKDCFRKKLLQICDGKLNGTNYRFKFFSSDGKSENQGVHPFLYKSKLLPNINDPWINLLSQAAIDFNSHLFPPKGDSYVYSMDISKMLFNTETHYIVFDYVDKNLNVTGISCENFAYNDGGVTLLSNGHVKIKSQDVGTQDISIDGKDLIFSIKTGGHAVSVYYNGKDWIYFDNQDYKLMNKGYAGFVLNLTEFNQQIQPYLILAIVNVFGPDEIMYVKNILDDDKIDDFEKFKKGVVTKFDSLINELKPFYQDMHNKMLEVIPQLIQEKLSYETFAKYMKNGTFLNIGKMKRTFQTAELRAYIKCQ